MWSSNASIVFADRVLGVQPTQETVVFGVLFCDLAKKPNILQDLESDLTLQPLNVPDCYFGDSADQYYIEDESGRLALDILNYSGVPLVSGLCVAILGREADDGRFVVSDMCLPGIPATSELKPQTSGSILVFSGLSLGDKTASGVTEFDFLVDVLLELSSGSLTIPHANFALNSVLFAGNCLDFELDQTEQVRGRSLFLHGMTDANTQDQRDKEPKIADAEPLRALDARLATITQIAPVILAPGSKDPTNLALPQAPIQKGLFPLSSVTGKAVFVANPAWFSIDGVKICMSAGQNLDDLARYASASVTRDKLAELCLAARHVAPSAPDTLWCRPFYTRDPFVLEHAPHLFIIGNQPSDMSTRVSSESSIVIASAFNQTKRATVVNLEDGTTRTLSIELS